MTSLYRHQTTPAVAEITWQFVRPKSPAQRRVSAVLTLLTFRTANKIRSKQATCQFVIRTTDVMDEGMMISNVSRGYGVGDGDAYNLSLRGTGGINYNGSFSISREMLEDLLRQMEYDKNFDSFTQVSAGRILFLSVTCIHGHTTPIGKIQ